jgi:hypothetical protein
MKGIAAILLGFVTGAFFMLHGDSAFAFPPEGTPHELAQNGSMQAVSGQKSAETLPAVRINLDKTSLDNHGTIDVKGAAPPGKPVYIEVWTERNIRASRFDSEPDRETGKRPYILYMTEEMPAYLRVLTPSATQSTPKALKSAKGVLRIPAGIAIRRHQASLLGSVVGSRGELLPPMDGEENTKCAMRLLEDRFKSAGGLFVPNIELEPDGSFSAKVILPKGAPEGRYNVRAVVDDNIASRTATFENKIAFPYIYLPNAGTSINLLYPFLLSLVISIFGVLMGAGGGFILNPLLVSLWSLPHTVVAGTVMPTILFSQGSGIVNYAKIKFINWKLGISIGIAMLLGGFIGPKLTEMISVAQYKFVFGWILIVLAGLMLWQTTPGYLAKNKKEQAILKEYRRKAEEASAASKLA